MSDYIDRQAPIEAVHREIFNFFNVCEDDEESPMTYEDERLLELNKAITGAIKEIPSAEVEPVVRCRDCKNAVSWYGKKFRCFLWSNTGIGVFEDGFCSYGARMDGEQNEN